MIARHVVDLASYIVHAAEHDQGNRIAFVFDERFDVFIAQAIFTRARRELDERCSWIESVEENCDFTAYWSEGNAPRSMTILCRSLVGGRT